MGNDVRGAIVCAVRKCRSEGFLPTSVTIPVDASVALATVVLPRKGKQIGCGLAVDVDGALVTVFASSQAVGPTVDVTCVPMEVGRA